MLVTALNFSITVIFCLLVGYLLGYYVRSSMEQQQPRTDERKKKSYDVKI